VEEVHYIPLQICRWKYHETWQGHSTLHTQDMQNIHPYPQQRWSSCKI